jgi:hypothetical protein
LSRSACADGGARGLNRGGRSWRAPSDWLTVAVGGLRGWVRWLVSRVAGKPEPGK